MPVVCHGTCFEISGALFRLCGLYIHCLWGILGPLLLVAILEFVSQSLETWQNYPRGWKRVERHDQSQTWTTVSNRHLLL